MFLYDDQSENEDRSALACGLGLAIGTVVLVILVVFAAMVILWWAMAIGAIVGGAAFLFAFFTHVSLLSKAHYNLQPWGLKSIWDVHCDLLAFSDTGLDGIVGWRGPITKETSGRPQQKTIVTALARVIWHFFCMFLMPGQLVVFSFSLVLCFLVAVFRQGYLYIRKLL